MATPQREEPKRKVLVAPSLNETNVRSMVLAGIAALISMGAHALLIIVVYQLGKLNVADAKSDVGNAPPPLVEGPKPPKKEENKEQKKEADRGKEDDIDLSRTDIGNDSFKDTNYDTPKLGDISAPPLNPMGDTPGFDDPKVTNTTPMTVPPPPGSGGGPGGGIPSSDFGTAPMIPGLEGKGGFGGNALGYQFAGRGQGVTRERMLEQGGGNKESEATVAKGLVFLSNHQNRDGHWSLNQFDHDARKQVKKANGEVAYVYERDKSDPRTSRQNDTAGTAFGLLPFLAAGHTHLPVKDSKFDYSKNVDAGLKYLIRKQDKDGNYGGDMYAHGLATIAMCEAYGLTADNTLKKSAQAAVHYIEFAQGAGGGWRYGPKANPGDTSVTGWHVMALKSAQMSGLTVKPQTLKDVDKYLDSCESTNKGGYSYVPAGGETPAMTAVGLLCRQYLGVTPRNPGLLQGVARLEASPPGRNHNIYYLYYATQVMHHMGGDNWKGWNLGPNGDGKGGIRDTLIGLMDKGTQNADLEGSWMLPGEHGGGRLMSTSLALLTLEVYYRHLPLYRRDVDKVKDAK